MWAATDPGSAQATAALVVAVAALLGLIGGGIKYVWDRRDTRRKAAELAQRADEARNLAAEARRDEVDLDRIRSVQSTMQEGITVLRDRATEAEQRNERLEDEVERLTELVRTLRDDLSELRARFRAEGLTP